MPKRVIVVVVVATACSRLASLFLVRQRALLSKSQASGDRLQWRFGGGRRNIGIWIKLIVPSLKSTLLFPSNFIRWPPRRLRPTLERAPSRPQLMTASRTVQLALVRPVALFQRAANRLNEKHEWTRSELLAHSFSW